MEKLADSFFKWTPSCSTKIYRTHDFCSDFALSWKNVDFAQTIILKIKLLTNLPKWYEIFGKNQTSSLTTFVPRERSKVQTKLNKEKILSRQKEETRQNRKNVIKDLTRKKIFSQPRKCDKTSPRMPHSR